jgi:hypothetical protein
MRFLLGRRGMRLTLAAVAFCAAFAPAAAHAYCRTTTQPVPANYSPSRGCFTDGLYLFWRNACVSYSLNQSGSRTVPYDAAKQVIDNAFATWQAATCADGYAPGITASDIGPSSCTEVRYNADGPNQNLIVFRDDGWPYSDPNNTLGLTTVTFNAETGEIYDADMEINSSGKNLSYSDRVPTNGYDLSSVVTHEAGHFFGLAHATDPRATMYASYKPGTSALRTLSPDDVAGICAVYPNATTRTVSATVSANETIVADQCDPSPRHGFTAQCAAQKGSNGICAFAAPRPTGSAWASSATVLVAAASIFAARRRRTRTR